jgi:hypothetical protein
MFFGPLAHLSRLAGEGSPFDCHAHGLWCPVLIAVPVVMASLDVVENGCIARMLWTWPDLSRDLVHVSNLATRAKIMAGALTELLMAVLAMLWLVRRGVTVGRFERLSL